MSLTWNSPAATKRPQVFHILFDNFCPKLHTVSARLRHTHNQPAETIVMAPSCPMIASLILLSKGYLFLSSTSRLRFLVKNCKSIFIKDGNALTHHTPYQFTSCFNPVSYLTLFKSIPKYTCIHKFRYHYLITTLLKLINNLWITVANLWTYITSHACILLPTENL